jgi:predicted PurR-regulated permease PerM
VKGSFLVAVAQGLVGGVVFLLLGLGSPVLWGVMMAVLSLIPAVGSVLVWGPAAIYLLLTGAVGKGVILIALGVGIIGMVDNALRPILVGRDAGMPDYLILISTLGGLAAFGISGLVVGPVVAGLFLTVWDIFAEEFGEKPRLDGSSWQDEVDLPTPLSAPEEAAFPEGPDPVTTPDPLTTEVAPSA